MANISSGATVSSTHLLVDDNKSFVGTIAHLHRKNSDITLSYRRFSKAGNLAPERLQVLPSNSAMIYWEELQEQILTFKPFISGLIQPSCTISVQKHQVCYLISTNTQTYYTRWCGWRSYNWNINSNYLKLAMPGNKATKMLQMVLERGHRNELQMAWE